MWTRLRAVRPFILAAPILGVALSGCIVGGSAAPKKVPTPARVAAIVPTATPLPDPTLEPLAARLVAVRTIVGSGVGQIEAALNAETQQLPDSVRIDFGDAQAQFEIAQRLLRGANVSGAYVSSFTALHDAVSQYLAASRAYSRGSSAAGKEASAAAQALSTFDRDLARQPESHVASVAAAAQVIVSRAERVRPRVVKARAPHHSISHRSSRRTVRTTSTRPRPVAHHVTPRLTVVTPTPKPTRTPSPTATAVPTPKPTAPPRPTPTLAPTQPADQPASVLAAQALAQATMQALARTVTVALPISQPAFNTAHRVSNRLHTELGLTQEFHVSGDPRVQVRLDQIRVLVTGDLQTESAKLSTLGQHEPRAAALIRAAVALERRALQALSLAETGPSGAAPYATLVHRASVRLSAAEHDLESAKTILAG